MNPSISSRAAASSRSRKISTFAPPEKWSPSARTRTARAALSRASAVAPANSSSSSCPNRFSGGSAITISPTSPSSLNCTFGMSLSSQVHEGPAGERRRLTGARARGLGLADPARQEERERRQRNEHRAVDLGGVPEPDLSHGHAGRDGRNAECHIGNGEDRGDQRGPLVGRGLQREQAKDAGERRAEPDTAYRAGHE